MSLVGPFPELKSEIDPITQRQESIKYKTDRRIQKYFGMAVLQYGSSIFDFNKYPGNRVILLNAARLVQDNVLKEEGILDKDFKVLPDQEKFLPQGYTPGDRSVLA